MKVNSILKKITENWVAKVLCFVVAIMIYTFHQTTIFSRKTFAVPLNVIANGSVVPIENHPDFVRVTVRTNGDQISMLNADTVTARIDLNTYVEEGSFDVPVSISISPELRTLEPLEIKVKPEYIPILLEKKLEEYIDVEASVTGNPAAGYVLTGVSVSPPTAFVTGPRSIVSAVESIKTDKIDVTGANQTTRVTSHLRNENPYLKVNTLNEIVVTYTIEPIQLTKHFSNIPVNVRNLSPMFLLNGSPGSVSFDLHGPEIRLSNYSIGADTVYIDCSAISEPGAYSLPVRFSLPLGVTARAINADIINVTVVLSENAEFSE